MPDFTYRARNQEGKDVEGRLTANSRREVLEMLDRQSLFPIEVAPVAAVHKEIRLFASRPSDSLIAATFQQLADLLENGVSILESFTLLVEQTTHPTFREILIDIRDRVADGEALDQAFAAHSKVFGDLTVSIVRAGAEGAFLEDALRRTSRFLEMQAELKGKVFGAMIYPVILAIVGLIIVFVLLTFFVPKFTAIYDQSGDGMALPFLTQTLLWANVFITHYGLYAAGVLVFAAIWLQGLAVTPAGRRFVDRSKLKVPLIGPVILISAVARFCRILGTLLANGVPIIRALEISGQSADNVVLTQAIVSAASNVSSGESLSRPLAEAGIFPKRVMAMIAVAEEANNLENVLINIADTLDRQVSQRLDIMLRFIEPGMLLVMGCVVFYIILAMLLPIFNMGSGIE
ncbi:MAG: type II secretion system F family protein [Thermoguttaceae bacterium]